MTTGPTVVDDLFTGNPFNLRMWRGDVGYCDGDGQQHVKKDRGSSDPTASQHFSAGPVRNGFFKYLEVWDDASYEEPSAENGWLEVAGYQYVKDQPFEKRDEDADEHEGPLNHTLMLPDKPSLPSKVSKKLCFALGWICLIIA
ncbi:MAG: hypothetical protein QXO15_03220 [Nitrososphaerota archaeon]